MPDRQLLMTILTDRRIVIASIIPLVALAGAIMMLWAFVLDPSGMATALTVVAMFLATAAAARWSGLLLRLVRVPLTWLSEPMGQAVAALARPSDGRKRLSGRTLQLLQSAAAGVALGGGLLSLVLAFLSAPIVEWAARRFGWTPASWAGLQLALQFVMLLPLGLAASAVFGISAVVRRSGGQDRLVFVSVDCLLGLAGGLLVFVAAWWLEVNMLILAGAMAGTLLVVAWLAAAEGRKTSDRVVTPLAAAAGGIGGRLSLTLAGVSLVLAIQFRLLSDLIRLGTPGKAVWAAVSLTLLAGATWRVSRRGQVAKVAASAGGVLGAIFAVAMQTALAFVCLSLGARGMVAGILAGLLQWPLAMLAGEFVVRHRRKFIARGGSNAGFLAGASAGAGVGLLVHLASGMAMFQFVPIALVAAVGLGATVAGLIRLSGIWRRLVWGLSALTLLAGAVVGVETAADSLAGRGQMLSGAWLRTVVRVNDGDLLAFEGALPTRRTWRSEGVSQAMHEILSGPSKRKVLRRGRWWVVAGSFRDWPTTKGVNSAASVPDPSALSREQMSGLLLLGSESAYLLAAQVGQERFDGVLLAPLPADHPNAWRCYNAQTLSRCYRRLVGGAGGIMMLRTQVGEDNLADAFDVVKTFIDCVGPSWVVATWGDEHEIDLLVAGPRTRRDRTVIDRPSDRPDVLVAPAEEFWPPKTPVRSLRLLSPRSWVFKRRASVRIWHYHLQQAAARSAKAADAARNEAAEAALGPPRPSPIEP